MTPTALFVLALGLGLDSFAVALGKGACARVGWADALRVGIVFGAAQGAAPLLGGSVGTLAMPALAASGPWIAFGLLAAVGGGMAWAALRGTAIIDRRLGWLPVLAAAVATSVDAGAVGMGLALVETPLLPAALLFGGTTVALAGGGLLLGRAAGRRLGRWAGLAGGLGLVAIGATPLAAAVLS